MTTVAYKNGVMAADHGVAIGDTIIISNTPKITMRSDGAMCGVSGSLSFGCAFMEWFHGFEKGERPLGRHDNGHHALDRAIIVRTDDSIESYESGDLDIAILTPEYYAMGSGRDIAIGALAWGADPEGAVMMAVKHDAYTRLPITVLRRP